MRRPPPHTLRGQLTAGLVLLLAAACLAVGLTTVFALEGFLVRRLDQQLTASGGRFAASLEHEATPDTDNRPDSRGQADQTFGARLLNGRVTQAAVVDEQNVRQVPLTHSDRQTLQEVPADGKGRSVRLSGLGSFRVSAVPGDDQDVLITGLPLHPVEETLHRLEGVEGVVFGAALLATAVAGAFWVRISLRPLQRVTKQAVGVARLPLASGEVAMPDPLPVTDPRTEVGQVGTALNRMLGHVGDALTRRQASEERLRHFAADASHELRTPVANIRGHAELALRHRGPVPADVRRALERIQSESGRMGDLVDDLLLLARLDAGRPLEHEPVDLTLLVLDAADDARAAGPGHRWILDLPEEPVTVTGDAHRLQQAIGNLLTNARTHTPAGTEVTVRLVSESAAVRLTVTDDGPGIPESLQPEIFGRFVRADRSRSRATGSTGLGLAIVRAVVTAHAGSIQVSSEPGRTVFEMSLPR
ncbi:MULTISPECIES: sensor histidine kinase [unclassified Streptomyces]|uniref:sensor histidine kinase n=1 Tax=unclassified Streptomyces TaxID=2593676 RepID=UPI002DD8BEBD|nr:MULTISPECIES: HAMP domain-containing sensor histidine kinase [unclassified Streptomyces]WSF82855.1 HAMP domain-containing histidine kinase [Streptomyces sp. NBC_01744]WSC40885.1 HAMP domain-containing histidine kinase [Streptomyces sp. NBC_01763]WSC49006.1 HAMP domain-containing histidine kinase [Streptomyces sp. NBC_01762]WSC52007.1 HAMP domain-containing histidine kinase [Streptomyces sp. NBC_01761]WSD28671.1 HAMP domain-containing histidine kinase [Streptomyces sp. NBC_01751]